MEAPHRSIAIVVLIFVGLSLATARMAPLFDPDEGYYPATASESLDAGTFWDLRFNGQPRWEKPILPYALIQTSFALFGHTVTAARLPSALEGGALIAIVGLLVARLTTARAGVLCAIVTGTTLGVSIFARIAHPEIGLVLGVVPTELLTCLWLTARDRRARRIAAIGIGFFVAYGVLSKGPVGLALPMLALLVALPFVRVAPVSARTVLMDLAFAGAVAIGLIAPWYVAMLGRHGWAFIEQAIWQQNVARYTSGAYGHRSSILSLAAATVIGLLPWASWLPVALSRLQRRPLDRRDTLRVFMCVGAVSAFAFYALSASKLASYSLACIPPLAIVIGLSIDDDYDEPRRASAWAWTRVSTACVFLMCGTGLSALTLVGDSAVSSRQLLGAVRPDMEDIVSLLTPVTIPVATLVLAAGVVVLLVRTPRTVIATIATTAAMLPVVSLAAATPILQRMYPWETFGRAIQDRPAPVWLVGRRAPSFTFYARQPVFVVADLDALARDITRWPESWIAVTRDEWAAVSSQDILISTTCRAIAEGGRMILARCVTEPRLTATAQPTASRPPVPRR